MAKKIELDRQGLGDVSDVMNNVGVSDLSWLNVNEEEYREWEALPQQNFDIVPDLERSLSIDEEDGVPARIPLREHTIVNVNPLDRHGTRHRDVTAAVRNRTARYIIGGMNTRDIGDRLTDEFSGPQLRTAAKAILEVLDERGLLGNVYVNASHFPRCAQDGEDRKFVATKAKRALYVLAKSECSSCVHCDRGFCSSFGKKIVSSVPYTEQTLAHYAVELASEGRTPAIMNDVRMSLRTAFRSPSRRVRGDAVQTIQHHPVSKKPKVTAKDMEDFKRRQAAHVPMPSPEYMAAALHLMRGGNPVTMAASTDPTVRKMVGEYGIIGHTYLDADALGGCRATLSFVKASGNVPRHIVMRAADCPTCKGKSDGACAQLRKMSSVVPIVPPIGGDDFKAAIVGAVNRGAVSKKHARAILNRVFAAKNPDWKSLTADANLLQPKQDTVKRQYGGTKVSSHYGTRPGVESPASIDGKSVLSFVSQVMNSGVQGDKLRRVVLSRYSLEDLKRVPEAVRRMASEDGVQGVHFIDPTAYPDYGKGCMAGSKKFRKRGAPYILASSSCTGCTLQTAPGWCSRYSKCMIRKVSTEVRRQASEVRASRPTPAAPVSNPVADFDIESPEMPIDTNGSRDDGFDIELNPKTIDS